MGMDESSLVVTTIRTIQAGEPERQKKVDGYGTTAPDYAYINRN
jgi:hypothetical protein